MGSKRVIGHVEISVSKSGGLPAASPERLRLAARRVQIVYKPSSLCEPRRTSSRLRSSGFRYYQNEIGPDVAVAVIAPLARERVIEVASRQRRICSQQVDDFYQNGIKLFAAPSRFSRL
jgi:hypothetical protein